MTRKTHMRISWKFKIDAQKHLDQLKNAMPKDRHFIRKTNRDKSFPFEIVSVVKGKMHFSGSPIQNTSISKKIKNVLRRKR